MNITENCKEEVAGNQDNSESSSKSQNIGTLMGEAVSLGGNLGFTERKQAENIILAANNVLSSRSLIYIILSAHSTHARWILLLSDYK